MIFEAIRACNRRIDSQKNTLDDFYARIHTQDWYRDISDQDEDEEMEKRILALRTDHLVGDDFEVMHHIAELCDNGPDPCQDHHFQKMMPQHRRIPIELLRALQN